MVEHEGPCQRSFKIFIKPYSDSSGDYHPQLSAFWRGNASPQLLTLLSWLHCRCRKSLVSWWYLHIKSNRKNQCMEKTASLFLISQGTDSWKSIWNHLCTDSVQVKNNWSFLFVCLFVCLFWERGEHLIQVVTQPHKPFYKVNWKTV